MRRIIVSISTLIILLTLSGCAKNPRKDGKSEDATGSKVVWIAKDGYVSRSYTVSNTTLEQKEQRLAEPGDVILFRTPMNILGTTGQAGEAYGVDETKKLRKIGEFALTKTDEELVKEYQN